MPRAPQLLSLCSRAHMPQLLSPRTAATEARVPGARAPRQESHHSKKPAHRNEE